MSHFNGTEQPPRALLRSRSPREERRELPRSFHSPPALLRTACHRFIFNRAPHTMAPGAAHFAALLSCLLLFFHLFHSFLFLYLFGHLLLLSILYSLFHRYRSLFSQLFSFFDPSPSLLLSLVFQLSAFRSSFATLVIVFPLFADSSPLTCRFVFDDTLFSRPLFSCLAAECSRFLA